VHEGDLPELDFGRAGPRAIGKDGKSGSVDPADPAAQRNRSSGPQHQGPAHPLVELPDTPGWGRLDPQPACA